MKTKFLALVTIALSTVLFACGSGNPIQCPAGQMSSNGACIGTGMNGLNGINNGGWNNGGWNNGGWNNGGWNNGGWNNGGWNNGGAGVGTVCLSFYGSGCPMGYVYAPNYNNCLPVSTYGAGSGNIWAQGWGAQIGIQYNYQQVSTPFGILPSGPCAQWCGPGYAYVHGACYR